jgi:membrane-bound lytic murein transglycosylase B
MWDYIDLRASPRRITNGKAAMEANAPLFADIGRRYGVEPHLLGAIWGIETNYGSVLGDTKIIRPIVRSLATLVHQRRSRLEGDEADLIAALLLVQRGPLDARHLVGSWAGAIGHLQVNPSNVIKYGTDGDGDGAVDLQNSLADALATSAVFLRGLGYQPDVPCSIEVAVPDGFVYLLADRTQMRPVSFFAGKGIARVRGEAFADPNMPVFLYVPAGKDGPKFLMTQNYMVLKGYNLSDSYAMAVAHLADRLNGAPAFADDWPRETQFPNIAERKAIQEALIKLGFLSGEVDGRIGPISQAAYARYQASRGEVADGFITKASYEELAAATR